MKKNVTVLIILIAALFFTSCPQVGGGGGGGKEKAVHFYVAAWGGDHYPGTFAEPFRSPQRAVQVITQINDGKTTYVINILSNITAATSQMIGGKQFVSIVEKEKPLILKINGVSAADGKTPEIHTMTGKYDLRGIFIDGVGPQFTKVTLQNITLTGCILPKGWGCGVEIYNGSLTLASDATIEQNRAYSGLGGGVAVTKNAHLIMLDGSKIFNNYANHDEEDATAGGSGGGVFVGAGSIFYLQGGVITENAAEYSGGGVDLDTGAVFYLTGGEISKNRATSDGGGIKANDGSILNVSGSFSIKENTIGSQPQVDNNLYLANSREKTPLVIAGALTSADSSGITPKSSETGDLIATSNNGGHVITEGDMEKLNVAGTGKSLVLNGNTIVLH